MMRKGIAVALLALAACGQTPEQYGDTEATRAEARGDARLRWDVVLAGDSVRLVAQQGDSARTIHADSLSETIEHGAIVRRCFRPTSDGRTVTFCRDTRAMEAR